MTDSLIAPQARARFVVTLPPEPSEIATQLEARAGSSFTTLTDTKDAFLHLARRAKERLVIMTPFIDHTGASWARDLFRATEAKQRVLILRDAGELDNFGVTGVELRAAITQLSEYSIPRAGGGIAATTETFHAKIVLADGAAAYVGSANFLYRSRETNLECGFLLDGDAVAPVAVLVEAVLGIFEGRT